MVDGSAALAAHDFRRLAELHRATLASSVLGRMGIGTLERYYRWAAESPLECLFLIRPDLELQAAAVLSFAPHTVIRRFACSAPGPFAAALVSRLARDGALRSEVGAYVRERTGPAQAMAPGPELLQIFVARDQRHRSRGTTLIRHLEDELGRRGISEYSVRTLVKDNEPTLAFYRQRQFESSGERWFCGQRYLLLTKSIGDARYRP